MEFCDNTLTTLMKGAHMNLENGMFAAKLYELEKQFDLMHSRLLLCQKRKPEKLEQTIAMIEDECLAEELVLERRVRESKSHFASELADLQLSCSRNTKNVVTAALESCPDSEARGEILALNAEFAIDYAMQAMNRAVLAAMYAQEAQAYLEQ